MNDIQLKAKIREHCLANGYTIKDGYDDLKPYVYEAAASLIKELADEALEDTNQEARAPTFQDRVAPWLVECFGEAEASDLRIRNYRFIEEALELVQAGGCTRDEAYHLVDYVFNRPKGEVKQEIGGVMTTLAALSRAHRINMHEAGDDELTRVWGLVEQIRAKSASKPLGSPLPSPQGGRADPAYIVDGLRELCGYVENASDARLHIFQDDATRDWIVKVITSATKGKSYYGRSMTSALLAAIEDNKE